MTNVLLHLALFDTLFSPRHNAYHLFPDDYVEPEMSTSSIVFRKLATLLSLPVSNAMVATPADTGSAVFLRSGHAIGWSPVTWPNLGSISGWNLGCHVGLACRPSAVENKHACSLHTWSNMEVVRLRHLPSSTLQCYKLMNYELWRAKPLLHFTVSEFLAMHVLNASRNKDILMSIAVTCPGS